MTRRPVSTKGSFSSPPRKCTSGLRKNFFSLDSLYRGLMELRVKNFGRNSKKNVSVLSGLITIFYYCTYNGFKNGGSNSEMF